MATLHKIIPKEYRDSVALMQLSSALSAMPGIVQASAVMATANNLELLREAGLNTDVVNAGPSDLLVVVQGEAGALPAALAEAQRRLSTQSTVAMNGAAEPVVMRSLVMALEHGPANLALISTPGEYAAAEALKAINLGLNVMLFSDNVNAADEAMLKRRAQAKNLIVMGPDCGTAIINGVPLAFANVVRRGAIGCVAASGTGLQEVTSLIDRYGQGISQAIGTGGHDLSVEVGGITMLKGLADLAADVDTAVIVLISKPPAAAVAERILSAARACGKPVVVNFLGADDRALTGDNIYGVRTLEDAARAAVTLAQGKAPPLESAQPFPLTAPLRLHSGQRYVRGLYSGGTFCYEATLLLSEALDEVWANTPAGRAQRLEDVWSSRGHTLVDLGDDVFTRGRPHPMIDHRLRNDRILREAADPQVAVILLDVVLGFGSHPDPAAEIVPTIDSARERAARDGREIAFVGHICGTDGDPQDLRQQTARLSAAGMRLTQSNAQAVRLAQKIVAAAGGGA
jgi:succinyl-CoA synthetase alpha subunit